MSSFRIGNIIDDAFAKGKAGCWYLPCCML